MVKLEILRKVWQFCCSFIMQIELDVNKALKYNLNTKTKFLFCSCSYFELLVCALLVQLFKQNPHSLLSLLAASELWIFIKWSIIKNLEVRINTCAKYLLVIFSFWRTLVELFSVLCKICTSRNHFKHH